MTSKPLLSICIPTFSRAGMLEVCLATVLPQVKAAGADVECVVSDNASEDSTADVIARYAETYSIRSFRNDTNIGLIGNVTKTAAQLAEGAFVWLIGDDDVMVAGAVGRVIDCLRSQPAVDLVALNVGYCSGDQRPDVESAQGGVNQEPTSRLRCSQQSGIVPFEELFEGPCADLTAIYSVVLRQSLWVAEFPQPYSGDPFVDVRSTYPHSFLIAHAMPGKQAALVSDPSIMIYELPGEEYSWAKYRAVAVIIHATALLTLYESNGVPRKYLESYYRYQLTDRGVELGHLIWNPDCVGGWREAIRFARMMRHYPWLLLKAFCVAMTNKSAPWLLAAPFRTLLRIKQFV